MFQIKKRTKEDGAATTAGFVSISVSILFVLIAFGFNTVFSPARGLNAGGGAVYLFCPCFCNHNLISRFCITCRESSRLLNDDARDGPQPMILIII